jgi:nitrogen fixation/metabolism regulation signal transduction histidine kinase
MNEPIIKNPINMNGTIRNAATVLVARTLTSEERQQTKLRLNMKDEPQTLVQFFTRAGTPPVSHPVAADLDQVIAEFKKAGVTLTHTITKDFNGEALSEAINLGSSDRPTIDVVREYKSAAHTAEEDKKYGSKVVFRDPTGATSEKSGEYWLLTRPETFLGERKVPGFGNGSGE